MTDDGDKRDNVTAADVLTGERGGVVDFAQARQGGEVAAFEPDAISDAHAVVLVGGSAAVLQETWKLDPDGGEVPLQDRVRLLSQRAFEVWFRNERYYAGTGDKYFTAAQLWLQHSQRRQYRGLVFDPVATPPGYYNLFQGFRYDWALEDSPHPGPLPTGEGVDDSPHPPPAASASPQGEAVVADQPDDGVYPGLGSCALFLDHVRANICDGDEGLYRRVIAWAAHIFQKPAERIGVALALRGGKGTGKTVFGEVLGELLGLYWLIVDHPRYVTGQFNGHMETLLLLQADEAFWAGSKEGEGALKGLITSREHLIEKKGVDQYRVANYVRLLVTSNERWAVPASYDERRWLVLDVADHAKQNRGYFEALFAELNRPTEDGTPGGGYAALFRYLMAFDLSKVDLSRIPQTRGLLEQKLHSLDPHEEWWHECLWQGWIAPDETGFKTWPGEIEVDELFNAYAAWFQKNVRRGHSLKKEQLAKDVVYRFVPGVRRRRASGSGRPWVYVLSDLETCRSAFDEWIGGGVGWLTEDVDPQGSRIDNRDDDDLGMD